MEDYHLHLPTPAEEDPILHGRLTALPRLTPRPGFEDRVLSHVWRPAPRWVRESKASWTDTVESGRVWFVLGGLAAGSLIPVAVTVGLAVAFSTQMGGVGTWMLAEFGPGVAGLFAAYWSSATQATATWWSTFAPANAETWAVGVAAAVAFSAAGLILTLRRGTTGADHAN